MLKNIKNLFIHRTKNSKGEKLNYELNERVRHKIVGEVYDHTYDVPYYPDHYELEELVKLLDRNLGKNMPPLKSFLFSCSVEEFLTAIELLIMIRYNKMEQQNQIFRGQLKPRLESFIRELNSIFKIDKIGYEIVQAELDDLPYIIVPYNSQYLHNETIKKPINLMHDEDFKGALDEFESALEEYRKSEYKDAIHKANKAYESTLKTILDLKKISHSNKDNIPKLVVKIKDEAKIINEDLEAAFNSFWSVLENGPPTIRNRPGVGHGQGKGITEVEKSYADFVLHLVGTYIVFLIERYKETK